MTNVHGYRLFLFSGNELQLFLEAGWNYLSGQNSYVVLLSNRSRK